MVNPISELNALWLLLGVALGWLHAGWLWRACRGACGCASRRVSIGAVAAGPLRVLGVGAGLTLAAVCHALVAAGIGWACAYAATAAVVYLKAER